MLVLSRKPGESIMVGEIRVVVVRVDGPRVVVAIDAPKSVSIRRSELPPRKANP